ncbi:MAG TPA: AAA family ATPase [Solirubrobacterales bacterium]|nr:AAA family ATPase [Solirubrobacterales bacterium]
MLASPDTPVLILTGPSGVGKTTVAGLLAERTERAVHLEADVFFRFVRSGYVEPWKPESHDQNRLVMEIVGAAAASYAKAGYLTIVDGIVIPRWFLDPLREMLQDAGLAVAYAVIRAPLSVCTERVRAREGDLPLDSAALEGIWAQFADLGELERNVVDVSASGPEQVADAIARRLDDGSLSV